MPSMRPEMGEPTSTTFTASMLPVAGSSKVRSPNSTGAVSSTGRADLSDPSTHTVAEAARAADRAVHKNIRFLFFTTTTARQGCLALLQWRTAEDTSYA